MSYLCRTHRQAYTQMHACILARTCAHTHMRTHGKRCTISGCRCYCIVLCSSPSGLELVLPEDCCNCSEIDMQIQRERQEGKGGKGGG